MDSVASAAFRSWSFPTGVILLLLFTGIVYLRGWLRLQKVLSHQFPALRLVSFLTGLALVFVALESPLDAFSFLLLQAHMVQHLLLMMAAPPLLLLGQPMLPMLRGLPRAFVKEGLGPFLRWPAMQKLGSMLVFPVFTWVVYNVCVIGWHVPFFYELAMHSPQWHELEHASFFWSSILFWWPVILPWPSRAQWPRWSVLPYLIAADLVNTAVSATFIFADKVLYPSYAAAPLSSISPRDDQAAAGAIMWVPGSVFYLVPTVIVAMRLLTQPGRSFSLKPKAGGLIQIGKTPARRTGDLLRLPVLGRFLRWRHSRTAMQSVCFAAAIAVMIDGWRGPRMAPMNLAGVLPWIHWRGLVIIALLAAGNLFCMACPFMLPRNIARLFISPRWRWPRALRSKWIAALLIAAYLWAYEAFSMWNNPAATAWIIAGYFGMALLVDGFFRDASFCKYVCPIGQFNFINSLVSPYEVKVRDQKTCHSCKTFDCIRGNKQQRGCELYLFQPKKATNLDCTFCLDCVHACPHDNIGLLPVNPAAATTNSSYLSSIGRVSKRPDIAALCLVIVFGAFANAAAMIAPLAIWENQAVQSIARPVLIALFIFGVAALLPACAIWACTQISRAFAAERVPKMQIAASFSIALVPLGAAMWAAHLAFHLATGLLAIVPVIQRVFALEPDWGLSAYPLFTSSIVPFQIVLLDAGLLLALYAFWRLARMRVAAGKSAVALFLPWCTLACSLYAAGAWILLQPMQMRGMMMMH